MKKIFTSLIIGVSAFFLVACSGQEKLDGEWYRYYVSSNTDELSITSEPDVVIKDSIIELDGMNFTIDKEKKIIQTKFKTYDYTLVDDVLTFDGDTYVQKDSSKYKEIIKEIEKQE